MLVGVGCVKACNPRARPIHSSRIPPFFPFVLFVDASDLQTEGKLCEVLGERR